MQNPLRQPIFLLAKNYMALWPDDKRLRQIYPDPRMIAVTKLGIRYMPPFVALTFLWFYFMQPPLSTTIIITLFACGMPISSFLWLGWRAKSALPLSLLRQYDEMKAKLMLSPEELSELNSPPIFFTFAQMLNLSYKKLGTVFWDDMP